MREKTEYMKENGKWVKKFGRKWIDEMSGDSAIRGDNRVCTDATKMRRDRGKKKESMSEYYVRNTREIEDE